MPTNQLAKLSLLALAACTTSTTGGGGNTHVSRQQATSAYSAVSARLATALEAASPHASLTATIDVTAPCSAGGDIGLSGSYDSLAGFDVMAAFTACHDSDDTFDGDLHWLETIGATGVTDTWTGTLDFVDANGTWSCVFDYSSATTATSVHLSGTICGFDVTADLGL